MIKYNNNGGEVMFYYSKLEKINRDAKNISIKYFIDKIAYNDLKFIHFEENPPHDVILIEAKAERRIPNYEVRALRLGDCFTYGSQ